MLKIVALASRHCLRWKYGLLALLSFPTSPDHGAMIHLGGQNCQGPGLPPRIAITVSHNTLDFELLEDLADQDCPEGHGSFPLTLDGLPLLECQKSSGRFGRRKIDGLQAMREGSGVTSHVYTVWWESSAETADQTAALARQIIRSVRLLAVSDER